MTTNKVENSQLDYQRQVISEEYNDLECFHELRKDAFDRAFSALQRKRRIGTGRMEKKRGS
ncbi:hypothetical protein ACWE42_16730 [Sutcliffiella cohnii]